MKPRHGSVLLEIRRHLAFATNINMKTVPPPVDSFAAKSPSLAKNTFKATASSSSSSLTGPTSQLSLSDVKLRQKNIKDFFHSQRSSSSSSSMMSQKTPEFSAAVKSDADVVAQPTAPSSSRSDCVIDMDVVEDGEGVDPVVGDADGSGGVPCENGIGVDYEGGGVDGQVAGSHLREQTSTAPTLSNSGTSTEDKDSCHVQTDGDPHESPEILTDDSWSSDVDVETQQEPSDHQQPRATATYGVPLDRLSRSPHCCPPLPELKPQAGEHDILFRPHIRPSEPPRPFPNHYNDAWDHHHVRMPCSPKNMCPTDNGSRVVPRWHLIRDALDPAGRHRNNAAAAKYDDNDAAPFIVASSFDLEEAIFSYNPHYTDKWNFRTLHSYFHEELAPEETQRFFHHQLPEMIQLCLSLRDVVTSPPPLLRKLPAEGSRTVTMSRRQVAALLANAFFCTFPRRNATNRNSEFASFPEINFNRLFAGGNPHNKHEKLKALLHYFHRVTERAPLGTISYTRQKVTSTPAWRESRKTLPKLHISSTGTIEDAEGLTQVDFANKYLGGGTLGSGCVQEEIRFLICPELILSQLIVEELDPDECLIVIGAERYSNYSGYASSFKWRGNYVDRSKCDAWGRKCVEVVAMDALRFTVSSKQYSLKNIQRELNKAYCAFHRIEASGIRGGKGETTTTTSAASSSSSSAACSSSSPPATNASLPAIATGNWGCGAFGGDPYLKGLIQLMAAAEANRDVVYFTFGDDQLAQDLSKMHEYLMENDVTVGELARFFRDVDKRAVDRSYDKRKFAGRELYSCLMEWLESSSVEEVEEEEEEGSKQQEEREEDGNGREGGAELVETTTGENRNDWTIDREDGRTASKEELAGSSSLSLPKENEESGKEGVEREKALVTQILNESPDLFTDDDDDIPDERGDVDDDGDNDNDNAAIDASPPSLLDGSRESQETEQTLVLESQPISESSTSMDDHNAK